MKLPLCRRRHATDGAVRRPRVLPHRRWRRVIHPGRLAAAALVALSLPFALTLSADPALADAAAAEAGPANAGLVEVGQHVLAAASIDAVITNLRNWIMGLLVALATLFLTVGGVRYLMANGDPGEVEKAKGALRSAAIGYGLAVLAPVIVDVLRGIVGG